MKFLLVGVLVLAIGAATASSALAASPEWVVNGTALGAAGKAEFNTGAATVTESRMKLKEIVVKCTTLNFVEKEVEKEGKKVKLTEAFLEGEKGGKIKLGLAFGGCKVTTPATGCKITKETITTLPINLSLKAIAGELAEGAFEEEPKKEGFAKMKFAAESGCKTLSGVEVTVKGETRATGNKKCEVAKKLTINEKPSKLEGAGAKLEEFVQEATVAPNGVNNGSSTEKLCWGAV